MMVSRELLQCYLAEIRAERSCEIGLFVVATENGQRIRNWFSRDSVHEAKDFVAQVEAEGLPGEQLEQLKRCVGGLERGEFQLIEGREALKRDSPQDYL
jgi:hypothetical protein